MDSFFLFFPPRISSRTLSAMAEHDHPAGDPRNLPYNCSKLFYLCRYPSLFAFPNPQSETISVFPAHGRARGGRCTATPAKVTRDMSTIRFEPGNDNKRFASQTTIFEISVIPVNSNPLDNRIHV